MEFLWKAQGLGGYQGIFTHLLYNHYDVPEFMNEGSRKRCFSNYPANPMEENIW